MLKAEYAIIFYVLLIVFSLLLVRMLSKKYLKPVKYRKVKESISAYMYLLPSFVVLGIFVFWPIFYSFYLSFFKWDFQNQDNPLFIGFQNYIELFKLNQPVNITFNEAFFNTLLIFMTVIFIIHLIFDLKKIKTPRQKYLIISMIILGILSLLTINSIQYLNVVSALVLVVVYTILLSLHFVDQMSNKIFLRIIVFIGLWIAFYSLGVPEIIRFLSLAKEQSLFIKAIWNTTYYVLLSTPITILFALLIALLLNRKLYGKTFFRTVYFIPFVTSVVAISLVWQWIFNDNGLLNYILTQIGFSKIPWLKDQKFTIPTVAIISIWKMVGYYAIIFLAGLQNIDKTYYEAAEVDGATPFQKFKFITLPLLSPTTYFIIIVAMIGAFKVFDEIFILYVGMPGPYNNSGMTMVYYVYDMFYVQQRMGRASAAAYVLFGIILLFTILQMRSSRNRIHYES
ncbi:MULTISPECIES: carbohydrate ABC transporter permease [unclassified Petrotoga]|uniref:carbohydrate ABC transporter permease n=1 Tax=unclassified Petrotoga TaxID=2620614 RepID=UPI000CA01751|nr:MULTISPECIES: sugar ABC transporter permease [unclassified Petrotoga]PNR90841.1 sugar ABC transporter permease [Petrotoga sp. HWHPT.55.6.3]